MKSLAPLLRLVIRYRPALAASMVCSLFVGLLWGLNIGALYPILNVVFQGDSLQTTIRQQADESQADWRESQESVLALERQWQQADAPRPEQLRGEIRREQSRLETKHRVHSAWRWAADIADRWWPTGPFATLALVVGIVIAGTILRGAFQVANEILVSRITQRALFTLRVSFYRKTLDLDLATLTTDRTSRLMSRFTHDMSRINEGLQALLGQSVREPIKIVVCLTGAALVSWRLLIVALVVAPPTLFILRYLIGSLRRASDASMATMPRLYEQLERSLAGVKLVKTSNMERVERFRFRHVCRDILLRINHLSIYRAFIRPAVEVMTISGVSLAVLAGSYLVIHQSTHLYGIRITNAPLQPATLLLFYAFLMGASEPLKKLAASVVTVQRTAVAVDRVGELMNREATITSPPRPLRLAAPIAVLKMENIHFAYPSGSRVIRGIDLELRAGETVAIIGPNGCGKSTLVNLIPRLYDPTQGAIRLDGVDTRQMRLRDLRSRIAIVPQETLLLDDTVFNNIRYGSFRASEEQVVAASRMAQADAFITNRLPAGYETVVGERGCFLSGGQRQRISLARALLRDPEILILDEATSEIDTRSERLIHRALRASAKNRITIVIAHGRNILEVADRVIVLDGGVVQAEGAHQDLLASSTYYGQLFESQIPEAA